MCSNAGGGGGGIGSIAKSELTRDNIKSKMMPKLDESNASEREIRDAEKIQKQLAGELLRYATSRASDGSRIDQALTEKLTLGSEAEIKKAVKEHAENLTFGNKSALPEKLKQAKELQRDLVERQNRAVKVMNTPRFKKVKWLNNPEVAVKYMGKVNFKNYLTGIAQAYVDGKTGEYFKKSMRMEDLTKKFFGD